MSGLADLKNEKVVKLNKTNFNEFIDMLIVAYDEGRIEDFIAIFSHKYKEGEEVEGSSANITNLWFSGEEGSSVHCLGLVDVMRERIHDFMRD